VVSVTTKGRFAEGTWVELRTPSPVRVEPPCEHYVRNRCGGCQLQHVSYDAQLDAKRTIIADAFARIAKRAETVGAVRASPSPWRYRHKLTLAIRRGPAGWFAGLHPYDAPGRVFPLVDCPITDERVVDIWRGVMRESRGFPAAHELRGAVRLLGEGASFTMEGGAAWPAADTLLTRVPALTEVWWIPERGTRTLVARRGDPGPPGAAFAQVNAAVAPLLREHVLRLVRAHRPASVIDAYSGAGDTAVALAADGVRVTAIELDADAARFAAARLTAPSRSVRARVEHALHNVLPADVVILNPPRTGVDVGVVTSLLAAPPRGIVYVSCNPATLARDVARLAGYRVASLEAFDMFPQTAHVETVCELVPEAA
jgi:23S rRNA (uracil1939-C5)-methyltransferase